MEPKTFFIAGVQHHQLRDVIDDLSEGDFLDLVPEPTNKFDPNAVRIEHEGTMCGYVPRKFSSEVMAAIDLASEDAPIICQISAIDPDAKTWEMCEVTVMEEGYEGDLDDKEF